MIDEERVFIVLGFLIDPEFFLKDVGIPIVLPEIREFLINMPADICTIDDPNPVVASRFILL
jgi:hypothetical protein